MFSSIKSAMLLFIAAFIAGLCFEAGRFILSVATEEEQTRLAVARSKITGVVAAPNGLSIEDITVSPGQNGIRFLGVIRNSGDTEWMDPTVNVSLTLAGVRLRPCSKSLTLSLQPGEHRQFALDCPDLQTEQIPADFSYAPTVESAWYERISTTAAGHPR